MNDTNNIDDFKKLSLEEMEKRLTPKPEEYVVVKPKTREEQIAEDKKLLEDLKRMDQELPKYRFSLGGEDVVLNDDEWKQFKKLRFVYTDDESPVYESDPKLLMELLEMQKIKKSHIQNEVI